MSRIGKLPVAVPAGVEVKIGEENLLTVSKVFFDWAITVWTSSTR